MCLRFFLFVSANKAGNTGIVPSIELPMANTNAGKLLREVKSLCRECLMFH